MLTPDLNASRKADRETVAAAMIEIGERHGATVSRRDDPANPGYHGQSIALGFVLNGVGASLDVDNLHGGTHGLIAWFNDHSCGRAVRKFDWRFQQAVGDPAWVQHRHHKATSCDGWEYLAQRLDRGLALAAVGAAFMNEGEAN